MTIIESLYNYFLSCPLLYNGKINIDYLPETPTEYTIDVSPTTKIVKAYINGDSIRQYLFTIGSREYYGTDVLQNLANSGFYEKFADWVEKQSNEGNLPILADGSTPQKIEILSTGYMFGGNADTARYQIQCRLIYYKKQEDKKWLKAQIN